MSSADFPWWSLPLAARLGLRSSKEAISTQQGTSLATSILSYSDLLLLVLVALLFCGAGTLLLFSKYADKATGERRRQLPFRPPFPSPPRSEISYSHTYWQNSRGMLLSTAKWFSLKRPPRGVILLCCGYADTHHWLPRERAIILARQGFLVFALDYEGCGRSDGLHVFLSSFDQLVADVWDFFGDIRQKEGLSSLPAFLMGESMGGAVSILLAMLQHKKGVNYFSGAILLAPMCKIKKNMRPPALVIKLLSWLAHYLPTVPIVPSPDVIHKAFRRPEILQLAVQNPYSYTLRPRLGTALQLLYATEKIDRTMEDFDLPLLVLQGSQDMVTDPDTCREFYRRSHSKDKTLKLYDGMWHSLLSGELIENVTKVYADIAAWLEERIITSPAK